MVPKLTFTRSIFHPKFDETIGIFIFSDLDHQKWNQKSQIQREWLQIHHVIQESIQGDLNSTVGFISPGNMAIWVAEFSSEGY